MANFNYLCKSFLKLTIYNEALCQICADHSISYPLLMRLPYSTIHILMVMKQSSRPKVNYGASQNYSNYLTYKDFQKCSLFCPFCQIYYLHSSCLPLHIQRIAWQYKSFEAVTQMVLFHLTMIALFLSIKSIFK